MTTAARRTSRWTPIGIAAVILGFFTWWPLGLAVIGYIMWGGSVDDLINDMISKFKDMARPQPSSGNAAFDEYRRETLRRLEEEQAEFAEYVENLRHARDREEFERFMAARKKKSKQK